MCLLTRLRDRAGSWMLPVVKWTRRIDLVICRGRTPSGKMGTVRALGPTIKASGVTRATRLKVSGYETRTREKGSGATPGIEITLEPERDVVWRIPSSCLCSYVEG